MNSDTVFLLQHCFVRKIYICTSECKNSRFTTYSNSIRSLGRSRSITFIINNKIIRTENARTHTKAHLYIQFFFVISLRYLVPIVLCVIQQHETVLRHYRQICSFNIFKSKTLNIDVYRLVYNR